MIPTAHESPFTLPLNTQQWQRALRNGQGRAYLHISRHGPDDLHDMLLHALLHSLAYDKECEGDRGHWVVELIDKAGAGPALYPEFIKLVHEKPDAEYDSAHLSQRGTVLVLLARKGVQGAREALDRLFLDNRSKHPDMLLGALDIIELDGEMGLKKVCSALGNEAHANATQSVEDWFLNSYDSDHGDDAAIRVLEAARQHDVGISRFLAIKEAADKNNADEDDEPCVEENPSKPFGDAYEKTPWRERHLTVDEIVDWAHNAPVRDGDIRGTVNGRMWLRKWGALASDSEIEQIVESLDATESSLAQRRFLSVFSSRCIPRVSDKLLGLAESRDLEVRWQVYCALRDVPDPRIRSVALRALTPELLKSGSLQLWQSNYQPGDYLAIERALILPDNDVDLHVIIRDLLNLCGEIGQPECLSLLLFIYEHSPCGLCRSGAVDAMVDLGITPEWVAEECRFDAIDSIREKIAAGPE